MMHVKLHQGVGNGPKNATMLADTKYILVVDDDFVITADMNLRTLVRALDRADLTKASDTVNDNYPFDGAFSVVQTSQTAQVIHDDVIKWKHFPRYWPFVWPVNSPHKGPVTRSFDVFFDLRLNKRLSKHSWGWWFETPSRPLWRHCNVLASCLLWVFAQWYWLLRLWCYQEFLPGQAGVNAWGGLVGRRRIVLRTRRLFPQRGRTEQKLRIALMLWPIILQVIVHSQGHACVLWPMDKTPETKVAFFSIL